MEQELLVDYDVFVVHGLLSPATRFLPPDPLLEVTPTAGMALFFRHAMLHEGVEVTRGLKYVLRTDLMFEE